MHGNYHIHQSVITFYWYQYENNDLRSTTVRLFSRMVIKLIFIEIKRNKYKCFYKKLSNNDCFAREILMQI